MNEAYFKQGKFRLASLSHKVHSSWLTVHSKKRKGRNKCFPLRPLRFCIIPGMLFNQAF